MASSKDDAERYTGFQNCIPTKNIVFVEPLAVNAFETIRGWIRMVANPMRSYNITGELVVGTTATLSDPLQPFPPSEFTRNTSDGFSRRTGSWALHEQTYYFNDMAPEHVSKPEYSGLYSAEESASLPNEVDLTHMNGTGDNGTSFDLGLSLKL